MGNERIVRTFALALLGLVAFAVWRPSSPDPIEDAQSRESWFFINKAHPVERFDGVIYGDSRSLRGISPGIIGQEVPGLDLYNFSWNAGGMNPEMYREIENLLDPDAPRPVIILAPTALSLQTAKVANDQFHQYQRKPMDQVELYRHLPRLADWFQPVSPSVYLRRILGIRPRQCGQTAQPGP